MTPLYVTCHIIYTTLTSLILSLFLALRCLLRRIYSSKGGQPKQPGNVVSLYNGTVHHVRRQPVHHSFRLAARYALIDLDRPPYAPPHYLTANEARRRAKTNGPVYLLMIPPSVGYDRNPVIFYYCYDIEDSAKTLKRCIVEAYGSPASESVTFVFNPTNDLAPKSEYISPFMDMEGSWKLSVTEPVEYICAVVAVQHPKLGNFFSASFTGKRVDPSDQLDHDAFFWLMPHKVSIWAYWNALQLWWKNVPFYQHPKYQNPEYRAEAIKRDWKMQGCPAFGSSFENKGIKIDRCYTWKDAKWPWSWC